MVKALAKYSLFLSILLISGYCLISVPSQASPNVSIKKSSKQAYLDFFQLSHTANFKPAPSIPGSRKFVIFAELTEVEEDELTSKKYLEISKYFNSLSVSRSVNGFIHLTKDVLPYAKQFSHFSSYTSLNIIFEVFRI